MNWRSAFYAMIDCHKRAIVFQIPNQPEFEFLYNNGILELAAVKARSIGILELAAVKARSID